MKRALGLLYGVVCYAVFLYVFLRAIYFVWTMDHLPANISLRRALFINAGLLTAFAVQHSGMARQGFKRAWTRVVPPLLERSTYVLMASLLLLALVVFWQPLPGSVWVVENPIARLTLEVLFWCGWMLVLLCTLLIDHADLFGLKQSWSYALSRTYAPPKFGTPGPYRVVRHPLYLGFLIAFWSAPRMASGHLFFAVMCTVYILVAIQLEERDLVALHGSEYAKYRAFVSMLLPVPRRRPVGQIANGALERR